MIKRTASILRSSYFIGHSRYYCKSRFKIFFLCTGCSYALISFIPDMSRLPSKEELKQRLTPLQYHVTQEKGTEQAYTGCYDDTFHSGRYECICCKQPLFHSESKYDSGCGWPAFHSVLKEGMVKLSPDTSSGRYRTEVTCSKCDAHLGHVFDDGPSPTKRRFCINSASIDFIPDKKD